MDTWTNVTGSDGVVWQFNSEGAQRMLKSHAHNKSWLNTSNSVSVEETFWQKIGLMADFQEVKTDLQSFEVERDRLLVSLGREFDMAKKESWAAVFDFLVAIRLRSNLDANRRMKMFNNASEVARTAVDDATRIIKVARGVRDASVVGLTVIACVATGGVTIAIATAASAAGSAASAYQDTGDVQKAAVSGTLALVPLGGKAIQATKVMKTAAPVVKMGVSLGVDVSADITRNYVVNDMQIREAVKSAVIDAGLSKVIDKTVVDNLAHYAGKTLRSAIKITDVHGAHTNSNRLPSLAAESFGKIVETGTKQLGPVVNSPSSPKPPPSVNTTPPSIDTLPGARMQVERMALRRMVTV